MHLYMICTIQSRLDLPVDRCDTGRRDMDCMRHIAALSVPVRGTP
jgi:hypothetical protein